MNASNRAHQRRIDAASEAIRRAGSIGKLEQLAGIAPTEAARIAFWLPFSRLAGAKALDAGTAELKRRILAAANDRGRTGRRNLRDHPIMAITRPTTGLASIARNSAGSLAFRADADRER